MSSATGISKANQRQSKHREPMYKAYRNTQRREVNKGIRLLKHIERAPNDDVAKAALSNLGRIVVGRSEQELAERRNQHARQAAE